MTRSELSKVHYAVAVTILGPGHSDGAEWTRYRSRRRSDRAGLHLYREYFFDYYARAVPVLAEVDRTFNLDPKDVEAKITPRTKAIMVVHMMGNPARLDELKAMADAHGLFLVEDCAQAFGASYKGKPVGSVGTVGTFSFNVYKTITSRDGGMVVTNDEEIYKRCFAFHYQGHSPLRTGVEIGQRPLNWFGFSFH